MIKNITYLLKVFSILFIRSLCFFVFLFLSSIFVLNNQTYADSCRTNDYVDKPEDYCLQDPEFFSRTYSCGYSHVATSEWCNVNENNPLLPVRDGFKVVDTFCNCSYTQYTYTCRVPLTRGYKYDFINAQLTSSHECYPEGVSVTEVTSPYTQSQAACETYCQPNQAPSPTPSQSCTGRYFGESQCRWANKDRTDGSCQLNPELGEIVPGEPNYWKWSYCAGTQELTPTTESTPTSLPTARPRVTVTPLPTSTPIPTVEPQPTNSTKCNKVSQDLSCCGGETTSNSRQCTGEYYQELVGQSASDDSKLYQRYSCTCFFTETWCNTPSCQKSRWEYYNNPLAGGISSFSKYGSPWPQLINSSNVPQSDGIFTNSNECESWCSSKITVETPSPEPTEAPSQSCTGRYFGESQCRWANKDRTDGSCQLNPELGEIVPEGTNYWKWSYCTATQEPTPTTQSTPTPLPTARPRVTITPLPTSTPVVTPLPTVSQFCQPGQWNPNTCSTCNNEGVWNQSYTDFGDGTNKREWCNCCITALGFTHPDCRECTTLRALTEIF